MQNIINNSNVPRGTFEYSKSKINESREFILREIKNEWKENIEN